MEGNSTNRKLYITAILYIVSVYVFAPLFFYMNKNVGQDAAGLKVVSFALPFIFGLINLIAVLLWSKYADRDTLLTCAVMVKYALIPFYILGAICIALVFLLIFTPAVIMIFLGPAVIAIMCVLGWLILVMGSPYAIAYFIRSELPAQAGVCLILPAPVYLYHGCFYHDDHVAEGAQVEGRYHRPSCYPCPGTHGGGMSCDPDNRWGL